VTRAGSGRVDADELRAAVARVLDVDPASLTDDADFVGDLGVDSLMALEVVVVLEKTYGVRFGEQELVRFTSLRAVHGALAGKLATG
jgi:acyl carrier protein